MQKLLETTQVSQSVIVLSLHYIYRLKDRNRFTPAQPGSEFRIAVAGLMMANKFLDECVTLLNYDFARQLISFTAILIQTRRGQRFLASIYQKSIGWSGSF
jgi:hypothetical protein